MAVEPTICQVLSCQCCRRNCTSGALGQGIGLHVAAEVAPHAAQAFAAQLAPIEGVGAGIDPASTAAAAAVSPHAMQAGAADLALPPLLGLQLLPQHGLGLCRPAQAHVGAPIADPAALAGKQLQM